MDGIQIACLYSWGCQTTKILNVENALSDFLKKPYPAPDETNHIAAILEKLEPQSAYRRNGILNKRDDFLNEHLIRGYWLGNFISANVIIETTQTHNYQVLEKIKRLKDKNELKKEAIEKLLDCFVTVGLIIEANSDNLSVFHLKLLVEDGEIILGRQRENISKGFLSGVKRGDWVTTHVGSGREKISLEQAKTLKQNILEVLTNSSIQVPSPVE